MQISPYLTAGSCKRRFEATSYETSVVKTNEKKHKEKKSDSTINGTQKKTRKNEQKKKINSSCGILISRAICHNCSGFFFRCCAEVEKLLESFFLGKWENPFFLSDRRIVLLFGVIQLL